VPEKSKAVVKSNNVVLKLHKAESKTWKSLIKTDDKFKADDIGADKAKDPSASMMDMMKKMYEEGDDNMKRTIAEAWTKSRDKGGSPDL